MKHENVGMFGVTVCYYICHKKRKMLAKTIILK